MNTHHRINYIEFSAPDLEAIKSFYTRVFAWQFTDYGPDYIAFTDGSLEGGFARGAQLPGGPLVILYSNDLVKSEEAIPAHGGRVVRAAYDFPGGRRFHFADPAGNELAVWSEA